MDGGEGNDHLVGDGGNDILLGGAGIDLLQGDDGNDYLEGEAGIDLLYGGDGNDYLEGGDGDDLSSANGNTAGEGGLSGGTGDDSIYGGTGRDELSGEDGLDLLDGGIGDDLLFGGTGNDSLWGGEGNDQLQGGGGNDVLDGDAGNDLLFGEAGNDHLYGNDGDDELQGNDGNDILEGGADADLLFGQNGNDTLSGDEGADYLDGGSGDDIYLDVTSLDTIFDNEGNDTIQTSVTYILSANLENLTLTGTTAINGTGNSLNNVLTGNGAINTLTGGTGNDTYVIDMGDIVFEALNEGTDTVQSSITFTLGADTENLTLTGATAINGTGNTLNNVLTGNSAANTLSGGAGADALIGGAGNDTYIVDNILDVVTETFSGGTDLVKSRVTYTLAANVDKLTLLGATAINGTGNALNNVLTGNSAINTLTGGAGNDTYVIGAGDSVVEALNEGTDSVQSSTSYTLTANVENLTLTGTTAIDGTGNTLNNILYANDEDNILNGLSGVDAVSFQHTASAVTVSLALGTAQATGGSGSDMLLNIENLTGSAYNDTLTGNASANVLDGGIGADTLSGDDGSDTYILDNVGDIVSETNATASIGGTDLIQAYISYSLTDTDGAGINGGNVENLRLMGTNALNATGNALNNGLYANTGNNHLNGGTGTDTLSYLYGASAGINSQPRPYHHPSHRRFR